MRCERIAKNESGGRIQTACHVGITRACLKNHSRDLHSPLCGSFIPNLINIARYAS